MKPSACSSIAHDPDMIQALHTLVRERLRSDYDITSKISKKQTGTGSKFPTTPGRQRSSSAGPQPKHGLPRNGGSKNSTVFGRALRDLAPTSTILDVEGSEDNVQG